MCLTTAPSTSHYCRPQWLWYHTVLRPSIMWAISSLNLAVRREGHIVGSDKQSSDNMEGLFLSPKRLSVNPKMNQGKTFPQNYKFQILSWNITANHDWLVESNYQRRDQAINCWSMWIVSDKYSLIKDGLGTNSCL